MLDGRGHLLVSRHLSDFRWNQFLRSFSEDDMLLFLLRSYLFFARDQSIKAWARARHLLEKLRGFLIVCKMRLLFAICTDTNNELCTILYVYILTFLDISQYSNFLNVKVSEACDEVYILRYGGGHDRHLWVERDRELHQRVVRPHLGPRRDIQGGQESYFNVFFLNFMRYVYFTNNGTVLRDWVWFDIKLIETFRCFFDLLSS